MDTTFTNADVIDRMREEEGAPSLDGSCPVRTRKIAEYCEARDEALDLYKAARQRWNDYQEAIEEANKVAKFAAPSQPSGWFAALEFGKVAQEEKSNGDFWETCRRRIDRAVWEHLIEDTKYASLMDAEAKKLFRSGLDNPAPVNEENCAATLASLYADAENMQNRGLVNIFTKLNFSDYKSNDCFSIGKRIIMESVVEHRSYGWSWDHYRYEKRDALIDLERTIDLLEGNQAKDPNDTLARHVEATGLSEQEYEDEIFKLRWYKKGTMHVYIKSPEIRAKLNRMIAGHFGANLADGTDRPNHADPHFTGKRKARNTGVSKVDRNAYYTPPAVADIVAIEAGLHDFERSVVLEPSCGHGSLMNAAFKAGCRHIHGVETHIASANAAQEALVKMFDDAGCSTSSYGDDFAKVYRCDFEKWEPTYRGDGYTHILMNPPFDHQMRHVVKAFGHLRKVTTNYKGEESPRGCLVAIMSASILTNNNHDHREFRVWLKTKRAILKRLPGGSFRPSGTDVETILVRIDAENE